MRLLLSAAALVLIALPAKAGLLLEPYLGYEVGQAEATYGTAAGAFAGGSTKWNYAGPILGARIGYTAPAVFFIAADYNMGSSLTFKVDTDASGIQSGGDGSRSALFLVAGAKILVLRGYIGYGFLNDWTIKDGTDENKVKGTALKLGASFTGIPIFAINFEMMNSTFTKISSGGTDYDPSDGGFFKAAKASSYMISLSAPFDL